MALYLGRGGTDRGGGSEYGLHGRRGNYDKEELCFLEKSEMLFSGNIKPVHEKTNNLGSDQVRHKPGCTITEDG